MTVSAEVFERHLKAKIANGPRVDAKAYAGLCFRFMEERFDKVFTRNTDQARVVQHLFFCTVRLLLEELTDAEIERDGLADLVERMLPKLGPAAAIVWRAAAAKHGRARGTKAARLAKERADRERVTVDQKLALGMERRGLSRRSIAKNLRTSRKRVDRLLGPRKKAAPR